MQAGHCAYVARSTRLGRWQVGEQSERGKQLCNWLQLLWSRVHTVDVFCHRRWQVAMQYESGMQLRNRLQLLCNRVQAVIGLCWCIIQDAARWDCKRQKVLLLAVP
jgi:Tfp pilus assembly protein PilN